MHECVCDGVCVCVHVCLCACILCVQWCVCVCVHVGVWYMHVHDVGFHMCVMYVCEYAQASVYVFWGRERYE